MGESLTTTLHVRVSQEDRSRVERLAARVRASKPAALAREALRLGLEVLERDPGVLVGAAAHEEHVG